MKAFTDPTVVLFWMLVLMLAGGCASQPELTRNQPSPYNFPLVSAGAQFAALPPDVQNTIRAQTGMAQIERIIRGTNGGGIFYTVFFYNRAAFPPLDVAADGSVLNPDLTVAVGAAPETLQVLKGAGISGLTLSDLPPDVLRSMQGNAPGAAVKAITKETYDGRVIYTISFQNPIHPTLHIAPDGTVLKGSSP